MKIVPIWLCLCIVMIIVACSSPNQVNIVEESGSNGADLEGANNDFYGIKLIPFGMFRSSSPKYPSLADSGWEYVWVLLSVTNDSDSLLYYSPPPLDEVKLGELFTLIKENGDRSVLYIDYWIDKIKNTKD